VLLITLVDVTSTKQVIVWHGPWRKKAKTE